MNIVRDLTPMCSVIQIYFIVSFFMISPGWAGIPSVADEDYPESRFGKAPLFLESGGRLKQTSEQSASATPSVTPSVTQGDDEDYKPPKGTRVPAGLETVKGMTPSASKSAFKTVEQSADSSDSSSAELNPSSIAPPSAMDDSSLMKGEMSRKGVQEISLIVGDQGFFPKAVFVSRDVPVRLFVTGASKNTLCFMMDVFQVRRQVRSQKIEEITFTPNVPGKFRFYCPVNGTEGVLVVKELSSK